MSVGDILIQRVLPSFCGTAAVAGIVKAGFLTKTGEEYLKNHQLTTIRAAAVAALATNSYTALEALLKHNSIFAGANGGKKRHAVALIGGLVLATVAGKLGAKTESLPGLVASAATALGIKLTVQYLVDTITADDEIRRPA